MYIFVLHHVFFLLDINVFYCDNPSALGSRYVLDGFSPLKELVWGPAWDLRALEISAARNLGM